MKNKNSRREFLRIASLAPVALVACRSTPDDDAVAETPESNPTSPLKTDEPVQCALTGEDIRGPFHIEGAPSRTSLAKQEEEGERLVIEGKVMDKNCQPIAGATLDVWHADAKGNYDDDRKEYRLRGQMMTDGDGAYRFETIKPGRYKLGDSFRPAHIHFIVTKPGYQPLTTQLYFEGDPYLGDNDPCGDGCNAGDPSLIIPLQKSADGFSGVFEIVVSK